ncbi:MAG: hypothetical protein J2P58_09445 [Acidimicrobiaceae bacterium]|nr:hypothetical protein [Acidimicrobiaceae bacterium]MBO0747439.1 hypothetical protein [Acidimicrobiaceae bacterium]
MIRAERARACPVRSDYLPTCSTDPFARLIWTLRQLAELLHLAGRAR